MKARVNHPEKLSVWKRGEEVYASMYSTVVRPAMLCGLETVALRKR